MQKIVKLFLVVFLIASCAPANLRNTEVLRDTTSEMKAIYKPLQEISFCLSAHGDIYNVLQGGLMSSHMPLCQKDATVIHSHPVWGEPFPNFWDSNSWKKYKARYGNEYFGIMKKEWYKTYHIP